MTEITLYLSDQRGNDKNNLYPHRFPINSVVDMEKAVQFDHVCAEYRNNHRRNENFSGSNCLPLDLDNDHSDDPSEWKTLNDVQAAFPGVAFYAVESRNHMKSKNGKSPRPKFHCYFAIHAVTDAAAYANLKSRVRSVFPWFDKAATDAARMIYGVEKTKVQLIEGSGRRIDEYLLLYGEVPASSEGGSGPLHQQKGEVYQPFVLPEVVPCGERNDTLFKYAAQLRARGLTENETRLLLDAANDTCEVPLEAAELDTILQSAMRYDVSPAALERATAMLAFVEAAKETQAAASLMEENALVCLADIEETTPDWLIPGYVPKGEITILGGDGGVGKTFIWCSIAAAISAGAPCPVLEGMFSTSEPRTPQRVLYFSSEDSNSAVLLPRLKACGANIQNIKTIDSANENFCKVKLNSQFLEGLLDSFRPALCIFDPIQSFLPPRTDMAARNQMREAMASLHVWGEKYSTSFLVVLHTNKRENCWGRKRLADSADLWDISRSVLICGKVEGGETRYLSHEKCSYGKESQTALFRISNGAAEFCSFTDKKDMDYVRASAKANDRGSERKAAENFIIEYLQERNGDVLTKDLDEAAQAAFITPATLRRAKSSLAEQKKISSRTDSKGIGKGTIWHTTLTEHSN